MSSPHTLFISDLHLQESVPDITATFINFLHRDAPKADALYILGDLFEVWIGDDDRSTYNCSISDALKQLASTGTPIYFIRGNRDFLIRKKFAEQSGISILDDLTVINLYGTPILLMHGDTLCTLDVKHQAYRKKVLTPWVQKLFLAFPLKFRRKFVQYLRQQSKLHQQNTSHSIVDVTPTEVIQVMEQQRVSLLIHGHTHRPAIHDVQLSDQQQQAQRIVLGSWHQAGSVLVYHHNNTFELNTLPHY